MVLELASDPSMVKVLPLLVCPYAKMQALKPSTTDATMGSTSLNTSEVWGG